MKNETIQYAGFGYDKEYHQLIQEVLDEGIMDKNPRPVYKDGAPAHSIRAFSKQITIKRNQLPLLQSKSVYYRDAIREMVWMWRDQSNNVEDLRELGCKIWNEWEQSDGTIGKTYGYQLAKKTDGTDMDQVEYLIDQIKNNPDSRRHITNMWHPEEGHEMALKPCVYNTQWVVLGDTLHVNVLARSTDIAIGLPYDIVQYWTLLQIIAHETGYKAGDMVFDMIIPHIYDRHVDTLKEMITPATGATDTPLKEYTIDLTLADTDTLEYFTPEDINIPGYIKDTPKLKFEIAI